MAGVTSNALHFCSIEDGDGEGYQGTISDDPLFDEGYRPAAGSPCVNGGTNLAWMAGATDLAGNERILNKTVDTGAYEVNIPPSGAIFIVR